MADDESVTSRRRERMAYRCSVTLGLADNVYVRFYILSGYDSDFQRSYFFFFFFPPPSCGHNAPRKRRSMRRFEFARPPDRFEFMSKDWTTRR